MNAGIRDTTAWYVIEQLLTHIWGVSDIDDEEILAICKLFKKAGGLWRQIIEGNRDHIDILDECIGNILKARQLNKIAARIAKVWK